MNLPSIIVFLSWLTLPSILVAETSAKLKPFIPKANGEECVRDTSYMRKNHMEFLFQKRDQVVLEGIRSKTESLNACLSCHEVKNKAGLTVSFDSPDHFCRTCHDFVSVKIDCFDCHTSVPDSKTISSVSDER
jgi:nitrate reductase cytochrome c-type subunit